MRYAIHTEPTVGRVFLPLLMVFMMGLPIHAGEQTFVVERIGDGPIISQQTFLDAGAGDAETGSPPFPTEDDNINGPSVIRVPDWLKPRLASTAAADANYILYFAHHRGDYMRAAWAEQIAGPWRLYNPLGDQSPHGLRGVMDLDGDENNGGANQINLENNLKIINEVASPDVFLDPANQRVVMYFHGQSRGIGQRTFVSTSHDGLNFNSEADGNQPGFGIAPVQLGDFYFRGFEHKGRAYAFANKGFLLRAPEGAGLTEDTAWTPPQGFDFEQSLWERIDGPIRRNHELDPNEQIDDPRHFGVLKDGDKLYTFFSRRNDRPERILVSVVDLSADDWTQWTATHPPQDVLLPELDWEGGDLPLTNSANGPATGVRQLRDPYIFTDADGQHYLFYTGRGEEAIGVARLTIVPEPGTLGAITGLIATVFGKRPRRTQGGEA